MYPQKALFAAFTAIFLWSTLAALTTFFTNLPPLFLTGFALLLGGLISLPKAKTWSLNFTYIFVGVSSVFFYHFLLFVAFRIAPTIECNLINYLWPLLIVLLAPLFNRTLKFKCLHVFGLALGFIGAAISIGFNPQSNFKEFNIGYVMAFGAALIWSSYSLFLKRNKIFSSWTIGLVCILSGLLALGLSFILKEQIIFEQNQFLLLMLFSIGPMGASFYLWNYAIKVLPPERIGSISYLTPILSTFWLSLATGRSLDFKLLSALLLIVGGAVLCRK